MAQKGNLINFTKKEIVVDHNPISLLPNVSNVRRQNAQLRQGQSNFEGNVVENKMRESFPEPSIWNQLRISNPARAAPAANVAAAAANAAAAAANIAAVNAAAAVAAPNLRGRPVLLSNANVAAAANAAAAANNAAAAANAAAYAAVNNRGRPVASAPPRPPNYNQQLARREEENLRRGINASLGRINPFNQYTNEELQLMKNNSFAGGKRRSRSKSKKSTKKKTTKKSRSKSKSRKH